MFGGGQLYAGHPGRAMWNTLGGPVVTLSGFIAGLLLGGLFRSPTSSSRPESYMAPAFGASILACTGYGLWSGWDAYRLVEEENALNAKP